MYVARELVEKLGVVFKVHRHHRIGELVGGESGDGSESDIGGSGDMLNDIYTEVNNFVKAEEVEQLLGHTST